MSETILGRKRPAHHGQHGTECGPCNAVTFRRHPTPAPAPSAPYFGGGWSLSPGAPKPTTDQLMEMLTRLNNLVDKWRKRAESMRAGFERQRREIAVMKAEAVERERLIERLEARARTLDRPRRKA